jgi:hypothetical protein
VLSSAKWNWTAPQDGEMRSIQWNKGEPIQAAEHRWDGGVLIP